LILKAPPAASTSSRPARPCWPSSFRIFAAARAKDVMVAFEAAVAGAFHHQALREGLTANRIQWIAGIINGTTISS
jgi:homoserine dehydrogenase